MKSKRFERALAASKKYAKNWPSIGKVTANGILLCHSYSEETKKNEGWFDDFAFKLGSQVVNVCWIHPRMKYHDLASEQAKQQIPKMPESNMFANSTKNYKTIGKNKKRKRLTSITTSGWSSELGNWFDLWNAKKHWFEFNSNVVVRPYINISQGPSGRIVNICTPVEAIDAATVEQLAIQVRDIVQGKVTLKELFGVYSYTKTDWIKEHPDSLVT